jgi:predicted RND superfamily exporter protein
VVFLAVAALYESWTIPFVNLLMLPLGLVGAVMAVTMRVLPNDVYLQIGLLTTIGLSTKNAILIIQFIKEQMRQGHELVEATLSAVKIRLRPVIMTSLAFFFGTLPLALTKGAGASAQNAIGTAVTGGLLSATFIDLLFIPFFFVLISRWFGRKHKHHVRGWCDRPCIGGSLIWSNVRLFSALRLCVLIGLAGGLVGCSTLAPSYTRPESPVPSSWHMRGGLSNRSDRP